MSSEKFLHATQYRHVLYACFGVVGRSIYCFHLIVDSICDKSVVRASMKCLQCNKSASFGLVKGQRLHCKDHKQEGEWNVKHDMCVLCVDEHKRATYKDENGKLKWCSAHAPENAESAGRKCSVCKTHFPNFGAMGGKKERCGKCRLPNDVYLGDGLCIVCNKTHASFGPEGDKRGSRCDSCRLPTDVAVRLIMCETCHTVMASFGSEDDLVPKRCAAHKLADQVDVKSKRCEICKKKRAVYGVRGGVHQFCSDCRTADHVDPYARLCSVCNEIRPSYGHAGSDVATRCASCKLKDDIKITGGLCVGCGVKYASFGNPIDGLLQYCYGCKGAEDLNLAETKCIECGVNRARFGIEKTERCTQCRRPDDRNLYCSLCIVCDVTIPSFAQPSDEKALRCFGCKIPGDVSKAPKCILCEKQQASKDGFCGTCHPNHIETEKGLSLGAFLFLSAVEKEMGVYIQFTRHINGVWIRDEHSCESFRYKSPVDGFIVDATGQTKGTVIEYEGDEWHGHPSRWALDRDAKMFKGALHRDKYDATLAKLQRYRGSGYRVFYIWESEALKLKPLDSRVSSLREFVGVLEPTPEDVQKSLSSASTTARSKKRLFSATK